ncbi:HAD family phosphatase [Psychromonas sp. 14N.309.X.WAT.B.A12]|uniref:HAD family hydrolase n=1 Tax=Psychromonas sp. 14N.309.X.WAT.B.A12 TaxID=2998322 RepID=UPI0025B02344|nr:HAD family phosphatase [Psychromonas sp. 14N.309.X.WAT.B.A12]MDN2663281.1 HAD family phosphatase [Psychromonas sp. 14N.309.X.WAT.B.A12]
MIKNNKAFTNFPKIWFFDMEGTILKKDISLDNGKVAPSAWTVLAKELGEQCYLEEEKTKDKWLNGEYIGYLDWMKDTVEIHKKYGLTEDILGKITNNSELQQGAIELLSFLKTKGVTTALITGGFKCLADKVQRKLKIDHVLSGCEYFFDNSGNLEFYNLLPSDNEGKVTFMQQIAAEHGVSPSECIFIGDGKNDIYLAEKVGVSVAFNAQIELQRTATHILNQKNGEENLLSILDLLT